MLVRSSFVVLSVALAGHVLPSHAFVGTPLPALRTAAPVSKLHIGRQPRAAAPLSRTRMAFSAVPLQEKPSVFARFQKTAFAAIVAFMMLLGAPGASHAETKTRSSTSGGSAGGSFIKSSSSSAPKKETSLKSVASPSVADTKASANTKPAEKPAADKVKPTKNVATTIKEGADGSKTKVVTTTTTDANGKKSVNTEKTIIKQGNPASATTAPAGGAPAAATAGGPAEIHVHHGAPAPSTGGMMAAAAGMAVGAAAASALAPPPAPWYNPWGFGMQNPMQPGMMQPGMPMQTVSPFGVAIGIKTAIITSIFVGLMFTIALVFLFRR